MLEEGTPHCLLWREVLLPSRQTGRARATTTQHESGAIAATFLHDDLAVVSMEGGQHGAMTIDNHKCIQIDTGHID